MDLDCDFLLFCSCCFQHLVQLQLKTAEREFAGRRRSYWSNFILLTSFQGEEFLFELKQSLSVTLDPTRVGRDAGRIADEVISHLVGLVGSTVKVTLEVEATIPNGAPDSVVRIVTENSRTLKFGTHGFEKD
jgi:hypothetical protein